MEEAVGRLKNVNIHPVLTHIYFNVYFMMKVYFRCGIISILDTQEKKLKPIYENTILNKFGLSEKFLHEVLYMRKSALGLGLIKPSTVIELQVLKLYVGYYRSKTKLAKLNRINDELQMIEEGYSKYSVLANCNTHYGLTT